MSNNGYVKIKKAANRLNISESSIRRYISLGLVESKTFHSGNKRGPAGAMHVCTEDVEKALNKVVKKKEKKHHKKGTVSITNLSEAEEVLGVTREQLMGYFESGALTKVMMGGAVYVYDEELNEAYKRMKDSERRIEEDKKKKADRDSKLDRVFIEVEKVAQKLDEFANSVSDQLHAIRNGK